MPGDIDRKLVNVWEFQWNFQDVFPWDIEIWGCLPLTEQFQIFWASPMVRKHVRNLRWVHVVKSCLLGRKYQRLQLLNVFVVWSHISFQSPVLRVQVNSVHCILEHTCLVRGFEFARGPVNAHNNFNVLPHWDLVLLWFRDFALKDNVLCYSGSLLIPSSDLSDVVCSPINLGGKRINCHLNTRLNINESFLAIHRNELKVNRVEFVVKVEVLAIDFLVLNKFDFEFNVYNSRDIVDLLLARKSVTCSDFEPMAFVWNESYLVNFAEGALEVGDHRPNGVFIGIAEAFGRDNFLCRENCVIYYV